MAWNRQTRMLADLTQIGCYQNIFNLTVNELDRFEIILDNNLLAITFIWFLQELKLLFLRVMLDSAKYNLSKMRWFGLIEFQVASELLFEDAFQPLHFATPFEKWNSTRGDDVLRLDSCLSKTYVKYLFQSNFGENFGNNKSWKPSRCRTV